MNRHGIFTACRKPTLLMESQHTPPGIPQKDDGHGHKITHNLDTGNDEQLDETYPDPDGDPSSMMDFGDGSGGGSAGDGAAA